MRPSACWIAWLAISTGAAAQAPPQERMLSRAITEVEPLDAARERARALFDLSEKTQGQLERARQEAARKGLDARIQQFLSGRDTLDVVLDQCRTVLAADLESAEGAADPVTPRFRCWLVERLVNGVTEKKYQHRKITVADLMASRAARLDLEGRLKQAIAQSREPGDFAAAIEDFRSRFAVRHSMDDLRELAQALLTLETTSLQELARGRVDAAETAVQARLETFRGGRDTLDILLDAGHKLLAAEGDLAGLSPSLAALEARWQAALKADQLCAAKFRVGTITIADFAAARSERREAEIALRQALDRQKKSAADVPVSRGGFLASQDHLSEQDRAEDRAQAKYRLSQADLPALRRDQLEAANNCTGARLENFIGGRDTLDALLKAQDRLAEVELAMTSPGSAQVAIYRKQWDRARECETFVDVKYRHGTVTLADQMQARGHHLSAALRLLKALERKGP